MVFWFPNKKPRDVRRVLRERRQQLGCGNAHSLAVQRALDGETHMSVFEGEQGVVFADADVVTGMELGATYCAMAIDRNHTPIIIPTIRAIDSLVIIDRPTGEMHSSAIEWIR